MEDRRQVYRRGAVWANPRLWHVHLAHQQQVWKIGDKYIGEVQYGRIHGFGTYTWRTNSKYVGQWKDGKMHGNGVKTDPHGNLFEGEWREGKPLMKGGQSARDGGPMDWLNEAVANVSTSVGLGGGDGQRGEYASVSTYDDDDDDRHRRR